MSGEMPLTPLRLLYETLGNGKSEYNFLGLLKNPKKFDFSL